MKALILNSGIGKRMGEFTHTHHKSMVQLKNGETIFHRQIRMLSECGIKEFVITSGAFSEQLIKTSKLTEFKHLKFRFVHNPIYDKTNYIYSMQLCKDYLNDDFLLLHGDLVFSKGLLKALLKSKVSTCLFNSKKDLPEKDFKGRIVNGLLKEVSINIFDDNCFAFQPLYLLKQHDLKAWMTRINDFVQENNVNVYAENALNTITDKVQIHALDYAKYYIDEIDNLIDLERVSNEILAFDYLEQEIFKNKDVIKTLKKITRINKIKTPLIVASRFYFGSQLEEIVKIICPHSVVFADFDANPLYEEVVSAIELFKKNDCDFIISFGGGSAIDIAKAVKLFLPLNENENYLEQTPIYSPIKHVCIPTTAGTGSDSTKYSVIYFNGVKQSLTHEMIIPEYVMLIPELLKSLPTYQKTATMLDALCQGIESFYSINATKISQKHAQMAINLILDNYEDYLSNPTIDCILNMQVAASYCGKAINISQTTAAHAMSYKITSLYGFAHGHAVAICLIPILEYMAQCVNASNTHKMKKLNRVFVQLAKAFKLNSIEEVINFLKNLLSEFSLATPTINNAELSMLVQSINPTRLKNNPIDLDSEIVRTLYQKISQTTY